MKPNPTAEFQCKSSWSYYLYSSLQTTLGHVNKNLHVCTLGISSHLLPDEEVAEEAAHLPFGQGASRERVVVSWQEVNTQDLNVAAVQCTAQTNIFINILLNIVLFKAFHGQPQCDHCLQNVVHR